MLVPPVVVMADMLDREGESDVLAVRKEGEERAERLDPGPGEGRRGVRYWDVVGERREEGPLVSLGVDGVVLANGLEGVIGALGFVSEHVSEAGRYLLGHVEWSTSWSSRKG